MTFLCIIILYEFFSVLQSPLLGIVHMSTQPCITVTMLSEIHALVQREGHIIENCSF